VSIGDAAAPARAIALADLNGDGAPDVAVATQGRAVGSVPASVSVLLNASR
jgi:hypothetical protein